MTELAEIAEALDDCANRISAGVEDPYHVICDTTIRLDTPPRVGSDLWLVLRWIEDLLEDIRGPFSRAASNAAARLFAEEWLTLDNRLDEKTQSVFFARWANDFSAIVASLPPPDQADRLERDASILAIIGRSGMRSATKGGRVKLDASLVHLAVEAWKRDEVPASSEEEPVVRMDRRRAEVLATIGRTAVESGRREGRRIVLTLSREVIDEALAAATELYPPADLRE